MGKETSDGKKTSKWPILQFKVEPCLQHMAAVRVIVEILKEKFIQEEITNYSKKLWISERAAGWALIETVVIEKILRLPVPKSAMKILQSFIIPLASEITEWIDFHSCLGIFGYPLLIIPEHLLDCIVWSPVGKIDYKETAETVITQDKVSDTYKYQLACVHCLEDKIFSLAKKIDIYENYSYICNLYRKSVYSLFWSFIITNNDTYFDGICKYFQINQNSNENIYGEMLRFSVNWGNEHAVKYFCRKLKKNEFSILHLIKDTILPMQGCCGTMCYLIVQANPEEQTQIFAIYGGQILETLLLDWIRMDTFLQIWLCVRNVLTQEGYNTIWYRISCPRSIPLFIKKFIKDKNILMELWKFTRKSLKDGFIDTLKDSSRIHIFKRLFSTAETFSVTKVIFMHANLQQKEQIISNLNINITTDLLTNIDYGDLKQLFLKC